MTDASASPAGTPATPTEVVVAYLGSFDERDVATIASHVDPGFLNEHTAALGRGSRGRDEYIARLPEFLASMPGLHYEIESLIADQERVGVFYTMTGRWQGETDFRIRGAQQLIVRDGYITHRTDYWDSAAFLCQVDPGAARALRDYGIG